jgi:gliding motility-associated-like protein
MKKFFRSSAMMLVIMATLATHLRASHIVGMDLTYAYTGTPNTFLVTLKYYSDCNPLSIPPPTSATICYSSASCGLSGTETFNGTVPAPIPIPPCIPNAGPTFCNGGTAYGVWEVKFEGNITLPQACNDWVFSFYDCCRNAAINTLASPDLQGVFLSTSLDNLNFPTNSSPIFLNIPVTQFCINNQFYYDQGATDVDGDSLAFFLTAPLDGTFSCPPDPPFPVTYNSTPNQYSDSVPFDTQSGVVMDNVTGIVSFVPVTQQIGVMAILVKEYRNGVQIGEIRRDIQLNFTAACSINPPAIQTFPVTLGGVNYSGVGVQCGDSSLILTFPTNPVQCKSIEPLGTDFRILAPNGQANPAISATAINCSGGVTDSILIHFYYPLKYGVTYLWTKIGTDGNTLLSECGSAIAEYDTVPIILEDTSNFSILTQLNLPCAFDSVTLTFPEVLDCYSFAANGTDLKLVDATGTVFNVSGAYGIGCNAGNPFSSTFHFDFSPVVNGTSPFYLISLNGTDSTTVATMCGKFVYPGDTIAILSVAPYLPITLGVDTTVCSTDVLPILNAGLTGATTYAWSLNGTPIGGNTQTLQSTGAGNYSVVVSIGSSCSGSDTVNVNVLTAPQPVLTNQAICDYDPLPVLNSQVTGTTYQWTFNGSPVGGNTATLPTQGTGAGTYGVSVSVGSCTGTASMDLTINASPNPTLNDNETICEGSDIVLDAHGAASDGVTWYYGGTQVATSVTYTATAAGYYTAILQSQEGCLKSDSTLVILEEPLQAPKVDCGAGNGVYKYIYTWNGIPGATEYEVWTGGQWVSVNLDTLYGTNSVLTDFKVRAVNGNSTCRDGEPSNLAPCEVIIPNIITPNGDNANDLFFIKNLEGHPNSSLKILNRWGNIILDDDNYQNDWDGSNAADGTYFYILKLEDGKEFTGTLTIINGKK